jgi:nucleoside 2-deoxyribosyltransferase
LIDVQDDKLPPHVASPGWSVAGVNLTMAGWARYRDLIRSGAGSTHAFMAMKFGEPEMEALFSNSLQPAVKETGFDLRTTRDQEAAGSIDNRMRVEIRTSRFLVCDLTHANCGAYWEAGFAEGLGRPVIYICRSDVLQDGHTSRPHFDVRQQLIIAWNPSDLQPAMEQLKATIRATMPGEARMSD